jgi:hypothetical protein
MRKKHFQKTYYIVLATTRSNREILLDDWEDGPIFSNKINAEKIKIENDEDLIFKKIEIVKVRLSPLTKEMI